MTDEELHGHLFNQQGSRQSLNTPVLVIDPTANLYDTYHVVQGETLRALRPVTARGRSR